MASSIGALIRIETILPVQFLSLAREAERGANMLRIASRLGLEIAISVAASSAAWTQDLPITEVRLGVLAHDLSVGGSRKEGGANINGTIFFNRLPKIESVPGWLAFILAPRPIIGGSVNTSGDTSYGHFGVNWGGDVTERLFVDFSFGGAIHSGNKNVNDPARKHLGCRVVFREALSVGVHITEQINVSGIIEHISNAGICSRNDGITSAGARLGYRF
jgi:lipid A 3-O-deacylase